MTGRLNKTIYRIDDLKNKVDILWINLLDGNNLVNPILEKYRIIDNYAEYILKDNGNRTEAIRNEIELTVNSFSIKLHPIDDNLKKVKDRFSVQSCEMSKSYYTSGSFDGEA